MSLDGPDTLRNPDFSGISFSTSVHALVLQQIENDAGVERTRPRSHHQSVHRAKSHRRGDAAPVLDRAHAGAIAEMGDDQPAAGIIGHDLRQCRDNVFVRVAVEAVAAHALLGERARQGEALSEHRLCLVKGPIETSNLRHLGCGRGDRADRGNMVRLMQWSERHQRLQSCDSLRVD